MAPTREVRASREQSEILTHELIEGRIPGYYVVHALHVQGVFVQGGVRQACASMAERHAILRTAFHLQDAAFLASVHDAVALDISEIASGAASESDRAAEISSVVEQQVEAGFDTSSPPLWRVRVLHFGEADHAVLLFAHHAITDGWSMNLLMDELMHRLAGGSADDLPAAEDYGPYAEGQQPIAPLQSLTDDAPAPTPGDCELVLPDLDADVGAGANAGAFVERRLRREVSASMRNAVRQLRATPNTILTAAWTALLARYKQSPTLVLGMAVTMRNSRALERMVGPCHGTVALRLNVQEDLSFAEHVAAVRTAIGKVMAEARTPPPGRGRSGPEPAIAHTRFAVHPGARRRRSLNGLHFEVSDSPVPGAIGDADAFAYEEDGEWRLLLSFRRARMGIADAADILEHFETLLHAALLRPGESLGMLPLTAAGHALSSQDAWRVGLPSPASGGLIARLQARAATALDEVTIVFGNDKLTRRELLDRSRCLASAMLHAGARLGSRVGLHLPRSPAMVVAQVAVRMIGASFVPLEPDGLASRLHAIMRDAAIQLHVSLAGTCRHLPGVGIVIDHLGRCAGPSPAPLSDIAMPDLDGEAYVLFTSGSTGQPKGVRCRERALLRQLADTGAWAIDRADVVLACAPTTFDLSLLEIWSGLLAAGQLVIIDPAHLSVEELGRLIVRRQVTTVMVVPRIFHDLLVRHPGVLSSVRLVVVGGDVNSASDFDRCRVDYPHLSLVAIYGPTETGVTVTAHVHAGGAIGRGKVPIGCVLAGTRLAVVDRQDRPVPPGLPGELLVSGDAVELGYLNDGPLTGRRFLSDPLQRDRHVFRTGDIVKQRRDGVLEFVGRLDRQVKLGGYRIELAEVEAAVLAAGQAEACVAALRLGDDGTARLVAILAAKPGVPSDDLVARTRSFLRDRLPPYAIPACFQVVSEIPVSAHGKIDASALLDGVSGSEPDRAEVMNGTTELLLDLAAAVLGRADVAPSMNFFASGGHSLAAIDLCRRLSSVIGREVPMRLAFEAPSLADMAASIDAFVRRSPDASLPPVTKARTPVPASHAQRRLLAAAQGAAAGTQAITPLPFRLAPPVDVDALRTALEAVVRRHPTLRSVFHRGADGSLQVQPVDAAPVMSVTDLGTRPQAGREAGMHEACRAAMAEKRDLGREPPMRAILFLDPPRGGILVLLLDHLTYDARSIAVISRDIMDFYVRAPTERPGPALSFLDYAAWEAERERDGTIGRLTEFAAARAATAGRRFLPPVHNAKPAKITYARLLCGGAQFRALARRAGTTVFSAVLARTLSALNAAQPTPALRLAVQTSTRIDRRLFDAVGPFMNTTHIDIEMSPDPMELARRVQRELLLAQDVALVPTGLLRSKLASCGISSEAVLPDVLFALQQQEGGPDPQPAGRITPLDPLDGWDAGTFLTGYAAIILGTLDQGGLTFRFGLHPDVADQDLGGRFAAALALSSPGQLPGNA